VYSPSRSISVVSNVGLMAAKKSYRIPAYHGVECSVWIYSSVNQLTAGAGRQCYIRRSRDVTDNDPNPNMTNTEPTNDPPSPATVWGVYNEKAKIRDKVLLKDWDSSINSLLLFVSRLAYVTGPRLTTLTGGHFCRRPNGSLRRKPKASRSGPP
jgi:hypothetical protein